MTGSLAYRTNEAAILRGDVPDKYLRLLPHIGGERIYEAGSAEGVLACLLARKGKIVTALEANRKRHANAKKLADKWGVSGVTFINGRIEHQIGKVEPGLFDTFVAVRACYYWRGDLDAVFAAVAERFPSVVLCGNKGRARRYHEGNPDQPLGEFNYYAGAEGMKDLLTRHGYRITNEVTGGDAIVVGSRA